MSLLLYLIGFFIAFLMAKSLFKKELNLEDNFTIVACIIAGLWSWIAVIGLYVIKVLMDYIKKNQKEIF